MCHREIHHGSGQICLLLGDHRTYPFNGIYGNDATQGNPSLLTPGLMPIAQEYILASPKIQSEREAQQQTLSFKSRWFDRSRYLKKNFKKFCFSYFLSSFASLQYAYSSTHSAEKGPILLFWRNATQRPGNGYSALCLKYLKC